MKLIIIASLISLYLQNAFSKYRFVIYTDQSPPTKAREVVNYFKTTTPFNEFQMEFVIENLSSKELDCRSHHSIDRLITCNTNEITKRAYNRDYDQVFVVSDSAKYGGSGGEVPVITSSPKTPVTIIGHEYLHRLGFCDEYQYSAQEANYYCTESYLSSTLNAAIITPLSNGYHSDQHAKKTHNSDIPWYAKIDPDTFISTGQTLGTPNKFSKRIGLFPSKNCSKKSPAIHVWQPGGIATIMKNLNAPIGPYVDILREALTSKGIPTIMRQPAPPPVPHCRDQELQLPLDKEEIKRTFEAVIPKFNAQ